MGPPSHERGTAQSFTSSSTTSEPKTPTCPNIETTPSTSSEPRSAAPAPRRWPLSQRQASTATPVSTSGSDRGRQSGSDPTPRYDASRRWRPAADRARCRPRPGRSSTGVEIPVDEEGPGPADVDEGTLAHLALRNTGIATSSRLRRHWSLNGVGRYHLLDPATGRPAATPPVATTVIAGEAWWAEALTKVVMATGVLDELSDASPFTVNAVGERSMTSDLRSLVACSARPCARQRRREHLRRPTAEDGRESWRCAGRWPSSRNPLRSPRPPPVSGARCRRARRRSGSEPIPGDQLLPCRLGIEAGHRCLFEGAEQRVVRFLGNRWPCERLARGPLARFEHEVSLEGLQGHSVPAA